MTRTEVIDRYKKIITPINSKLDAIGKEIAVTDEVSNVYWGNVKKEIRVAYRDAEVILDTETKKTFDTWYEESYKKEFRKVKKAKANNKANMGESLNKDSNKRSKKALTDQVRNFFAVGLLSGRRFFLNVASDTQKYNVTRKQIPSFKLPDSYKNFLKQILDNKYITIIDKNGKPRRYNAKSYAEMVARTQMTETHTAATVNVAIDTNNDLVKVSDHNTTTEICKPFEGNIYSLSGKSKEYPKATLLPTYHPNCLHYITIYK